MLDKSDIAELLTLQSQAYQLLMWLGEEAVNRPILLGPNIVKLLRHPKTAGQWLVAQREALPSNLVPNEPAGPFAQLFSSFFSTSFRVKHLVLDDRLVDSRLMLGITSPQPRQAGTVHVQALALKHLAGSAGARITEADARRIVKRESLRQASSLWAYVWELDRRARGKGKGVVVHALWRRIPWEMRKELTVAQVWEAREHLLEAARNESIARPLDARGVEFGQ